MARVVRAWDTRISYNVRHQRWWWSAFKQSTHTELWDFVDSKEQAFHDMTAAMSRHDDQCATEPISLPTH